VSAQIKLVNEAPARATGLGIVALVLLATLTFLLSSASVALAGTPPSNDDIANAASIAGTTGLAASDNTYATTEPFEPPIYAGRTSLAGSVWFRWTAPSTGYVTFATDGGFDSVMAAYEQDGSGFSGLRKKAENDDDPLQDPKLGSRITFMADAGKAYYVAVAGWYWTEGYYGPLVLSWSTPAAAPTSTAPLAEAAGDYSILAGQSVLLDASASFRVDGGSKDEFVYDWSFDEDTTFASGPSPTIPWSTIVESIPGGVPQCADPVTGLPAYIVHLTVRNGAYTSMDTALLRIYTTEDKFTLNYGHDANGAIEGPAAQLVPYGSSGSEVTATPAPNYHFVRWTDNDSADPVRHDTDVKANLNTMATFALDTYTLKYTVGTGMGTLSGAALQTVDYDTNGAAVTANAATGYHFVNWSDGKTVNPRTDINVKASVDVSANFAIGALDPVWRFTNSKGYYLWSAVSSERNAINADPKKTWKEEGEAYKINPDSNKDQLYRFRNIKGGFYLYSAVPSELAGLRSAAGKAVWIEDGPAYKVWTTTGSGIAPAGSKDVWRFVNRKNGTYLLTGVPSEQQGILNTAGGQANWKLEGTAFYIAQ
jgi:hypothetical protein